MSEQTRRSPQGNRLAKLANRLFVIAMTIMVGDGGYFFFVLFHKSYL